MIKSALNWLGQKVSGKVVAASVISAFLASSFIAWAQQTNYLGTVFVADSTTPTQQMRISSSGGVGISALYNSTPPTFTNGQRGDLQIGSRGSLHVELWGNDSAAAVATGSLSDSLSNAGTSLYTLDRGLKYNGSTWDRDFACTNQASATVTAAATTQIVALGASQVIRVCTFSIGMSASGTAKFVQGTGANCGTGTADITPATNITSGNVWAMGDGAAAVLRTGSGNALCVTAATGNAQVFVSYAQY